MGFELVGRVWDTEDFEDYIQNVNLGWADSVTVHHTAVPSLSMRPRGFTIAHMKNLQHYYREILGWSASPHLFVDDDQIFGHSSLYRRGVHARSFNATSIGIEALGNYDRENPMSGRGLDVWNTTAETVAIILERMNLTPDKDTVKFHRDDPKTSKTCPGSLVMKDWFLDLVRGYMGEETPTTPLTLEERVARIEKHLNLT